MEIPNLDKIYIIHYAPLKERREYLEKRLRKLGLENYAEWIVSSNDKKLTEKDLYLQDLSEEGLIERKKILGDKIPTIGRIDMIMIHQHIKVLRKIAKKGKKISMVFEDDVLLSDDFPKKLAIVIKKLNEVDWDICYCDKGSLFVDPVAVRKGIILYEPPNKRANTTGSYLVTSKSSKKILKLIKRVSLGPDLEMSYLQKKYNLKVYWTVPFLTKQGSIEEIYQSNVRKGTLTGILLKIIRRAEKINPILAKTIAILSDKFRNEVYNSKALIFVKNKIKKLLKY